MKDKIFLENFNIKNKYDFINNYTYKKNIDIVVFILNILLYKEKNIINIYNYIIGIFKEIKEFIYIFKKLEIFFGKNKIIDIDILDNLYYNKSNINESNINESIIDLFYLNSNKNNLLLKYFKNSIILI